MTSIDAVLKRLSANEGQALETLFEILRIPSVSTVPEHAGDCRRAAEWFREAFAALGFEARVQDTPGQPAVIAHYRNPHGGRPRLLYYGHYDVQPADPLGEWEGDPFVPVMADGPIGKRIVGRGAADDKGQVVAWMEAFRAHLQIVGTLPADVTVVIEGEEETGSLNFDYLLKACRDELGAEAAVVSDGTMWDVETPAITTQLRGLVYLEVCVTTAGQDLHSGLFGGCAPNAATALSAVLGALKDENGRIAFPEIYEDIEEPAPETVEAWRALGFDEARFLGNAGLSGSSGEAGYSALERLWSRPTADVNGIWGGFSGHGSKTIIPRQATAKVSFRLVPGQDPQKVVDGFSRFVRERLAPGAAAAIHVIEAAPAVRMPADSRWLRDAQAALSEEYGKPALLIGCGGSLGAVESFKRVLGVPTLLFSFGLEDDRVHAPNEKFELACFRHGMRAHARLLARWTDAEQFQETMQSGQIR